MSNQPDTFIGKWIPATAGERLLHLLVTDVPDLNAIGASPNTWLANVSRGPALTEFLNGVVVLHVFGRLLQAAKAYRNRNVDDDETSLHQLENFLVDKLNITRSTCSSFASIAPMALEAAKMSSKNNHTVPNKRKKDVQEEFKNCFNCYTCGSELDPFEKNKLVPHWDKKKEKRKPWRMVPNGRYAEYEHIWPHSFGGDTIVENLAPVCLPCNDAKENSVSWEWTLIQSLLPTTDLGQPTLESKHTSRAIKVSLHMRAAMMYARVNGTTLKDAFKTIGPREKSVVVIDTDDTPDFFNLRVHDETRTGIQWEA